MTADGNSEGIGNEENLTDRLRDVILFPGSKKEFEETYGYETEIVDLEIPSKGLLYADIFNSLGSRLHDASHAFELCSYNVRKSILEKNIVALINPIFTGNLNYYQGYNNVNVPVYFGLPIKKKDNDQPLHITSAKQNDRR